VVKRDIGFAVHFGFEPAAVVDQAAEVGGFAVKRDIRLAVYFGFGPSPCEKSG
jgi:hypothetical protein